MNIEEKAKAYDEALRKARNIVNSINVGLIGKDSFEAVFPELKESEDERIRKSLAAYFAKFKPDDMWNEDFSFGDILAWFKKQEQHKKFLDSIQVGDKVTRNKDGVLVNLSQLSRVAKKDEKQAQKPAELPKGEDYGIDGLYAAIDILQNTLGKVNGYQTDDGILEHKCAISAVKKLYEQKPAAWSEEDERKIYRIYSILGQAADTHAFSTSCRLIGDKECIELQDFLKSLRPQSQWKPSSEQITALDNFIYAKYPDTERYSEPIKSLYNDLKKLREKQL